MRATHWVKVVAVTGLLVGATAYAAPCSRDAEGFKRFDEQRVLTKLEKACATEPVDLAEEVEDEEEVSWYDWAFDGHRAPSFHFIDLLELLGVSQLSI